MTSIIKTVNLTKYYGRDRGIIDVNLDIKKGEIFGFIGPNGAGKSTAIRTLLGLIKPTSGSATIFGKDIATEGPIIREEIGYLPSEVFYYDNMRVKDLLNYSASFYHKPKKAMQTRIKELARLLNLDLNRKIDDLSYGNKKKVGIVQGLLHNPKLIILDEPTGGLDPLMQQIFFDLLRTENERGVTVLFSSHILSEVQKICDRVAIIKDGKLIRLEKMADLRGNNYLRCRFESASTLDAKLFDEPGISDVQLNSKTASFLYRGDVNVITRLLAGLKLKNVWIEEPELDEIFMHYYQKGDD
ncbi:ABC transporter ATP-binding protein [Candidatus Saccharibacteria bacterium]|nr:ABC transporter ATP-binding protein [Candidatus Saccharibacteria bacterium]NCU41011.1 ABC transporter ATP-binding protein [Candidatus Saccharibacteria bacterium]